MIFKPVKKAELHLRAKGLQFLLISNAQLRMLPPLRSQNWILVQHLLTFYLFACLSAVTGKTQLVF